jgi:hypothetical protein
VTVLVLTAPDDDTGTRVCQALDDCGCGHARMDLGDFPETVSFTATGPQPAWTGWLSDGQRDLRLSEITAVYYRRPTSFRLPAHLSAPHRRFAATEARQGLGGCLLYPGNGGVHTTVAWSSAAACRLSTARSLPTPVPPSVPGSGNDEASTRIHDCSPVQPSPRL